MTPCAALLFICWLGPSMKYLEIACNTTSDCGYDGLCNGDVVRDVLKSCTNLVSLKDHGGYALGFTQEH